MAGVLTRDRHRGERALEVLWLMRCRAGEPTVDRISNDDDSALSVQVGDELPVGRAGGVQLLATFFKLVF